MCLCVSCSISKPCRTTDVQRYNSSLVICLCSSLAELELERSTVYIAVLAINQIVALTCLTAQIPCLSSVLLVKLELVQAVLGDLRFYILALSLAVAPMFLCSKYMYRCSLDNYCNVFSSADIMCPCIVLLLYKCGVFALLFGQQW